MKNHIHWNHDLKKLMIRFCAFFLIGIAIMNIGMGFYINQARTEHKKILAAVFGNIMSAYPDVAEEELVKVLSGKGTESAGEELLAKYGVSGEYGTESFSLLERQIRYLAVFANVLFSLVFLTGSCFLLMYLGRRQRRISDLESYMGALHREGYRLDVEDNEDDELSGLRNEIYKLTVLLKEQADRAAGQKRALADSMADISHQLKTPLTSMTVLMDNLSEDNDMDPVTRQRFMSEITYQLTGMSWLITMMLKISRLDAGVVELERERLKVLDLVEEALKRLEITAEWNGVSFMLEIPQEASVFTDRKWTGEALVNIIKNAIEHSPRESKVKITAEENEVYTKISVRDYGKGITEEERDKLFRRFYHGASAREDSIGIGLALAKEIVEKQGGYISVDSQEEKGTTFVIKFLKGRQSAVK